MDRGSVKFKALRVPWRYFASPCALIGIIGRLVFVIPGSDRDYRFCILHEQGKGRVWGYRGALFHCATLAYTHHNPKLVAVP